MDSTKGRIAARLAAISAVLVLVSLSACTTNHGRYAMLSQNKVDVAAITQTQIQSATPISFSCKTLVLTIIPVSVCGFDQALEGALREGGGNVLHDVTITQTKVLVPLFVMDRWDISGRVALAPPAK